MSLSDWLVDMQDKGKVFVEAEQLRKYSKLVYALHLQLDEQQDVDLGLKRNRKVRDESISYKYFRDCGNRFICLKSSQPRLAALNYCLAFR